MTDPEWYVFDADQFKYVLTDKAPKEAVASYKEYYEQLEAHHKPGVDQMIIMYVDTFNENLPLFMMPSMTDEELEAVIAECLATGKPCETDAVIDPAIDY